MSEPEAIINYYPLFCSILAALADPTRLRMVMELNNNGPIRSHGFCSVRAAKGTIGYHQDYLLQLGIIEPLNENCPRIFRLCSQELDSEFPGLLDAILAGGKSMDE